MFEDSDIDDDTFECDLLATSHLSEAPRASAGRFGENGGANVHKKSPVLPNETAVNFTDSFAPNKTHCTPNTDALTDGDNVRNKQVKKIVQRRFPGPAGLLPEIRDSSINVSELEDAFKETGDANGDNDNLQEYLCSQTSVSVFEDELWMEMRKDYDKSLPDIYNIGWIKSNAGDKKLVNRKAPFLAAAITCVRSSEQMIPMFTLKDPTGEIQADIVHDLYEEYMNDLTVGSVIILRQFSVLSTSNETKHYLMITSNNLVRIYSKDKDRRKTVITNVAGNDSKTTFDNDAKIAASVKSSSFKNSLVGGGDGVERRKRTFGFRNTSEGRCLEGRDMRTWAHEDVGDLDLSLDDGFPAEAEAVAKSRAKENVQLSLALNDLQGGAVNVCLPGGRPGDSVKRVVAEVDATGERGASAKKSKTTCSQKLKAFRFRPKDASGGSCALTSLEIDVKKATKMDESNKLSDRGIDFNSQEEEDSEILQEVFEGMDVESLFDAF